MRTSPSDLEIGGELKDLPPGSTRYVTLNSLLSLPLMTYTVTGDPNFSSTTPTTISGIPLDDLAALLGAKPSADLVVAICDDKYRTNYPRAYLKAHHPFLVLRINGEPPPRWPKSADSHGYDMGPYMISHPAFTPSFKILSHTDEAQIPWGVVRLEFRNEATVFGAIAPPRSHAGDASVQAGYKIAQQNCFRCHNAGDEGGQKAGRPWLVLASFASTAPEYFSAYVRDSKKQNPSAQMPPNPTYDDATIRALRDYFWTLAPTTTREKR
jgi:mono/diheme cytochrome c family protein